MGPPGAHDWTQYLRTLGVGATAVRLHVGTTMIIEKLKLQRRITGCATPTNPVSAKSNIFGVVQRGLGRNSRSRWSLKTLSSRMELGTCTLHFERICTLKHLFAPPAPCMRRLSTALTNVSKTLHQWFAR